MRRALPAIAVGLTLLVVWPISQSAFHEPRRWIFFVAAALGVVLTLPRWRWTALPLVALTAVQPWHSLEAGLQALAFAWALAAWPSLRPDLRPFTRVAGAAAAIVGLVVVLQAVGLDVFSFAAPEVGTGRLRMYGTLGNPDFVASALLPIAILLSGLALPRSPRAESRGVFRSANSDNSGRPSTPLGQNGDSVLISAQPLGQNGGPARVAFVALLFIVPALVLTRSFATLLSALAAAGVLLLHRRGPGLASIGVLCAVLTVGLLGREPSSTLAGRRYLVAVALPHVADAPLLGHGLGATVLAWPTWELSYWQERCPDAACVAAHPERRFAALQDHVHADWLEWLLERGVLGALALVLALGAPMRAAWRSGDSFVLAALVAALARGLVDFPLHRPADLCLIAALAACVRYGDARDDRDAGGDLEEP